METWCYNTLILFYNLRIWEHIFEHGPHLAATAIGKLFSTIKLVTRTPALGSFCGTKVFMCVSQYMSLYISFTLMSKIKFAREKDTHNKLG